eukprot:m.35641 g.35641  ORF g.35641 m.35641 type:complete len:150 (+) comp9911_c0_seq1:1030-1479(+)
MSRLKIWMTLTTTMLVYVNENVNGSKCSATMADATMADATTTDATTIDATMIDATMTNATMTDATMTDATTLIGTKSFVYKGPGTTIDGIDMVEEIVTSVVCSLIAGIMVACTLDIIAFDAQLICEYSTNCLKTIYKLYQTLQGLDNTW